MMKSTEKAMKKMMKNMMSDVSDNPEMNNMMKDLFSGNMGNMPGFENLGDFAKMAENMANTSKNGQPDLGNIMKMAETISKTMNKNETNNDDTNTNSDTNNNSGINNNESSGMMDTIANMGENMGGEVGDIFKKINTVRNMPGADVDSDEEVEKKI